MPLLPDARFPAPSSAHPHRHAAAAVWRRTCAALLITWLGLAAAPGWAQERAEAPSTASPAAAPAPNSALDAPLFYQLLIGELELQRGELGVAYQVLLDAARRTQDEALYQRVVHLALRARAGSEAYAAARSWRQQLGSTASYQFTLQLAIAVGKLQDVPEVLVDWLALQPSSAAQAGLLAGLPTLLRPLNDRERALHEMGPTLLALRKASSDATRRLLGGALHAALAQHAGQTQQAARLLQQAHGDARTSALPAWLAVDWLRWSPSLEPLVLARLDTEPGLRSAYARALARDQRLPAARVQFERLHASEPEQAAHLYALGSLALELHEPDAALPLLQRYLDRVAEHPAQQANALLLLTQAHAQRKDWPAALAALDRLPPDQRGLEQTFQRALIELRQGQPDAALARIRKLPTDAEPPSEAEQRRRLFMELQLLREADRWPDALARVAQALDAQPDDVDLLYEHAMSAERLGQFELMERQLRRVIERKPEHHHAHNALGYALADRQLRLPEARQLIERAIELGGQEPALVDSLGWVAFREGKLDEAERWLRQAQGARPDGEITAHLVEVLSTKGAREEAQQLLQAALAREPAHRALRALRQRLGL